MAGSVLELAAVHKRDEVLRYGGVLSKRVV